MKTNYIDVKSMFYSGIETIANLDNVISNLIPNITDCPDCAKVPPEPIHCPRDTIPEIDEPKQKFYPKYGAGKIRRSTHRCDKYNKNNKTSKIQRRSELDKILKTDKKIRKEKN